MESKQKVENNITSEINEIENGKINNRKQSMKQRVHYLKGQ